MYLTLSFCTFGFMWIKKRNEKNGSETEIVRKSCGNRAEFACNSLGISSASVRKSCENRAEFTYFHVY